MSSPQPYQRNDDVLRLTTDTDPRPDRPGDLTVVIDPDEVADIERRRPPTRLLRLLDAYFNRGFRAGRGSDDDPARLLTRLVLYTDQTLASLDWEEIVGAALPGDVPIVRGSTTPPHGLVLPLSMPVRLLQVGDGSLRLTPAAIAPQEAGDEVVHIEHIAAGDLMAWRRAARWPTVDILHLDAGDLSEVDSLTTARPDAVGTLGWLRRLCVTGSTRLVLVECDTRDELWAARRLGHALTDAGGPAFIATAAYLPEFVSGLYRRILQDEPLDFALGDSAERSFPPDQRHYSCFLGSGREDLLRPSQVGDELLARAARTVGSGPDPADSTVDVDEFLGPGVGFQMARRIDRNLSRLRHSWLFSLTTNFVGPMSGAIGDLRREFDLPSLPVVRPASEAELARVVNIGLGEPERPEVAASERALTVFGDYLLSVDIGPKSGVVENLRTMALLDQVLKWSPEDSGRWVEIGVSGIDFAVDGAPVQELWLPREGASDPVVFAVRPQRSGLAMLRVGVYVDQNLVQSFRVVARTTADDSEPAGAAEMAAMLRVDEFEVEGLRWASTIEFAATDIDGLQDEKAALISIVANDREGEKIITVKGPDVFAVTITRDLPSLVRDVRVQLSQIAAPPIDGVPAEDLIYAFHNTGVNSGTDTQLALALLGIAEKGWPLFDQIFAAEDGRNRLRSALDREAGVIRVAHLLLEDVIPWALLYDRPYNATRRSINGVPVQHHACLAALPDAQGAMPMQACGVAPQCALHPRNIPPGVPKDKYAEVIACPLHIWGFRHSIEMPSGQADPTSETNNSDPVTPPDRILSAAVPRLGVALHAGLPLAAPHLVELTAIVAPAWVEYDSDRVTDRVVDDLDLDLLYFYCHAEGGRDSGLQRPALRLQAPGSPMEGWILAQNLGDRGWNHHPLVVINGCHTAAFSADALSPFVRKFTRDRRASGVLATEITVYEPLATEFAGDFLRAMVQDRKSAGDALLAARRRLLSKNNPLGLAYTLYARADLTFSTGAST